MIFKKNFRIENQSNVFVGGGILASLLASTCCVGPLILTFLGVSGSAALSKLEPIRIPVTVFVIVLFVAGGINLYKKRDACEPGSICADPKKYRTMKIIYWIGLLIAIAVTTAPQWLPWIFS